MSIQVIDLKKRYAEERIEILKCVDRVLKKGNLILTKEVENFERSICKFTKLKYCLTLNSGTDALMMSLYSLGIKKGDEVITTPISFVASVNAIIHIGAKPVFVDVGMDLNINPDLIEKYITKKTRAIIPVHWTGRICDMNKIRLIAKKYNLFVIEDAAQAMGATYKNKHAGSFGEISAFSAHPLKNLNALGDGGFVVTNKKKLFNKIKLYRNHGLRGRDDAVVVGVNSRLDSLNAEVLNFRLSKLNSLIKKRQANINLYKKLIETNKFQIIEDQILQKNAHVMFVVLCEKRDILQKHLARNGIQSLIYYKTPLHMQKSIKFLGYKKGDFPIAEKITKKVLALPHHQHLKKNEIKKICSVINEFYNS